MSLVGDNIRRLRIKAGIKPAELARRAGLSTTAMIELGHRRGCMDSLERIAKALGVPLAALFEERPAKRQDSQRATQ